MSRRQNKRPPPRQRGRAKDDGSNIYWLFENTDTSSISQLSAPWRLVDAAWFAAHPDRNFRLRPVMEGELANLAHEIGIDPGFRPVGTIAKVIARRPEWGEPSRAPILDAAASIFDQAADFEPMLQARFELTFEAMLSGETFVSGEALADRLTRIAKAAGIS